MKKIISSLSILLLLFSGYAYAEQDKVSVEVCKEGAESEGVSPDKMKEYIEQCVKDIEEDEKRELMEIQQER